MFDSKTHISCTAFEITMKEYQQKQQQEYFTSRTEPNTIRTEPDDIPVNQAGIVIVT